MSLPTLILATRNRHKVSEIRSILGEGFDYLTLDGFPTAPAIVEDANSFAGNATKKAVCLACWVAEQLGEPRNGIIGARVLADDSGLEVDALQGAPGVHSARFAAMGQGGDSPAVNSSDAENNAKLLRLLEGTSGDQRTARFRCVIALTPVLPPRHEHKSPACDADEAELQTEIFEGTCEGRIAFSPSGRGGFGYDPLFIPGGYTESFAELGEDVKNQLSHRGQALRKLRHRLSRGA